jgi:hypothetical protein
LFAASQQEAFSCGYQLNSTGDPAMTTLPPAAQAVLDAAIKVAESPDAEAIAAAALRAAAPRMQFVQDQLMLCAIAAELEGFNG